MSLGLVSVGHGKQESKPKNFQHNAKMSYTLLSPMILAGLEGCSSVYNSLPEVGFEKKNEIT